MKREPHLLRTPSPVNASPGAPADDRREALVGDGLLKIPEAVDFLRVGRSKLYELMDEGQLPYVRIGRCRLIPRRALVALAAAHLKGEYNRSTP